MEIICQQLIVVYKIKGCLMDNNNNVDNVKNALNSVLHFSHLKNDSALAKELNVTKQALSRWRISGIVPAQRALEMDLLTRGRVSWRQLCPKIVDRVEAID